MRWQVILAPLAVIAVVAAVVVGHYTNWFRGQAPSGSTAIAPPKPKPTTEKPPKLELSQMTLEVQDTFKKLKAAPNGRWPGTMASWCKGESSNRDELWLVARIGMAEGQETAVRVRGCQLVIGLLLDMPKGAEAVPQPDPLGIEALVRCLNATDAKVLRAAYVTLKVIMIEHPQLVPSGLMESTVQKQLGGQRADIAAVAVWAVGCLHETGMFKEVISAWRAHRSDETVSKNAKETLYLLAIYRERKNLQITKPKLSKYWLLRLSTKAAKDKAKEFGDSPDKWEAYWRTKPVIKAPPPVSPN